MAKASRAKVVGKSGNSRSPLTAAVVEQLLGEIDQTVIADILATGATPEELIEAQEWLDSDDYIGARLKRPMTGTVARLCDILEAEMSPPEER